MGVLFAAGMLVAGGAMVGRACSLQRRIAGAVGPEQETSVASPATRLRVWGAGERHSAEGFCRCAIVRRPERIYYETSDPAEIRDFVSRIRVRPSLENEPEVATCGTVTIDLLHGEKIALSIHPMGSTLRTWGASLGSVPITRASHDRIEEWLKDRQIRDKVQQDVIQYGVGR